MLQEEVVEMNQHAKQQRAIKGRFGRPNMGVRSTSKSFSTKAKTKQTHHDLTKSAYPWPEGVPDTVSISNIRGFNPMRCLLGFGRHLAGVER